MADGIPTDEEFRREAERGKPRGGGAGRHHRPARLDATATAVRRTRVAELYYARLTQEQIARRLGVDQTTVSKDLTKLKKEWAQARGDNIGAIINRELDILDANESLLIIQFRHLQGNAPELHREIIRSMQRRARFLGLDAPARSENYVRDESAAQTLLDKAGQYITDLGVGAAEASDLSDEPDGEGE